MHPKTNFLNQIRSIPQTTLSRRVPKSRGYRHTLTIAVVVLLSACATTPPDPSLLANAQAAITRASQAGGDVHAPLEIRLATRRLTMAQEQMDQGNILGARHLADQAQIEAELAFARTRAALARADLETRREAFETLQANLVELYGEEVLSEEGSP